MKNQYPEFRRKRIILLYTLAILVPGILLGYMAYQGILNDQARREKEVRMQLEGISSAFFEAADSSLISMLNTGSLADPSGAVPEFVELAFERKPNEDPLLIAGDLLFIPDRNRNSADMPLEWSAGYQSALSLEQQGRDLDKAAEAFRKIAMGPGKEDERVMAWFAVCRVLRKQNRSAEALESWEQVITRYGNTLMQGQVPVGLVALLEKIRIYQLQKDRAGMERELERFYQTLLHPTISYESNQFRFFLGEANLLADEAGIRSDSLKNLLESRIAQTEFYHRLILEKEMLVYARQVQARTGWAGLNPLLFEQQERPFLFISRELPEGTARGLCIDITAYFASGSAGWIQSVHPQNNLSWNVTNQKSDTLALGGAIGDKTFTSFEFPDPYPSWTLSLRENQTNRLVAFFTQGSGTFILIFVFVVLIMGLGLIFTLFALNQELKLNRLKSDFISNVSHELKSPLTSIRHLTDLLHRNRVRSEEQRGTYYATMLRQTEHLSYLIDNILDFSRLENDRKKYRFEPVDFVGQLTLWVEAFRTQNPNQEVEIRLTLPEGRPVAMIDAHAMQQVVNNLLDNAVKYSGSSKTVEVTVREGSREVITEVRDQGIGIPAKELDKIFDRFYRCEESSELGIRGSGIGLTIVQRIVGAHGGRVKAESEHGRGSTFSVHLPLKGDES